MFIAPPSLPVTRAKADRQRLRIQAEAVAKHSGLSVYTVRRIERGAETDSLRLARYVATVDAMAQAVRESLARLDALAAAGTRPMTHGELATVLTGGEPCHE